ncbi:MAG: VanZ family protein [Dehalococcoidia bacterium]
MLWVRRAIRYAVPPILVAGAIFWLSSLSASDVEETGQAGILGPYGGEIVHGIEYLALSALLMRALVAWRPTGAAPGPGPRLARLGAVAIAISALYGVSDEWHQTFVPGRAAEAKDVLIDFAGALVGSAAYAALYLIWRRARIPAQAARSPGETAR